MPPLKPLSFAVIALSALVLSGCSSAADATGNGGAADGLQVVATTTQVADFTRNVVGDTAGVDVSQLIQPNQSAHSYDPSAADLAALGWADVLVINGMGLEEWLDDAIDASGFDGITIHSDAGIDFSGDAAEHEAGDEHDHAAGNPHIWTAVPNAEAMVHAIASGLADASAGKNADNSADKAAAFEANAAAYESKLATLDSWIRSNIDAVPANERLLVSNHDAFGYFTDAYGITFVGSVIPSFDDNAEPSAADIDDLVTAIRAAGVKAVFSETSINPKVADTIAKEAGVVVYSGDDALYGDSLGPASSDGATYIDSQVHNVRLILRSWGARPSPLPPELAE